MSIYSLKRKQLIQASVSDVWQFFSQPRNLNQITPDEMNFRIVSVSLEGDAYPGQMIEYRVRVFPGFRLKWLTEITHVRSEVSFVDEQRIGPYAIWHHQHHFEPTEEGVNMTDIVTYKLPFGILGRIFHPLISSKLNRIFDYRTMAIQQIFT